MTPEEQSISNTTGRGTPRSPRRRHRPSILGYLVVLFTAAFLLLLLSYFMQQRRNDQAVIDGLQQSISAMQSVDLMREENRALQAERDALQKDLDEAQKKLEELEQLRGQLSAQEEQTALQQQARSEAEQTALALDWLWRIEREYFQGRRSNARKLIQAFQETGLEQWLPSSPMVDEQYRSPLEQYQAIYNILF